MIEEKDILALNYYNYGQPFSGSYKGMRYRIEKIGNKESEDDEDARQNAGEKFLVTIWPEPFSYENTNPSVMEHEEFEFSENGKSQLVAWLNNRYEQGGWHEGFTMSELRKLRREQ